MLLGEGRYGNIWSKLGYLYPQSNFDFPYKNFSEHFDHHKSNYAVILAKSWGWGHSHFIIL